MEKSKWTVVQNYYPEFVIFSYSYMMDIMERWYKCPKCGKDVLYITNPCPHCKLRLDWTQKPPVPYITPPVEPQQQSSALNKQQEDSTGFNWQKSKAHLLLLSKFIRIQQPAYFAALDYWKNVLGEPPNQSINRFIDEGVLITADLSDYLSYKYKVPELKDMLKQRSLPISGRKDEIIQHLIKADVDGMRKAVAELTLLKCSQRGQEIVEQYLIAEDEKRSEVEKQVIEHLTQRRFREASLTVAAYENEQVFKRGMGIDWKHYNPDHDVERLNDIFRSKPKIVAQLTDDKMEALRIGAAMMELWGINSPEKWLPDNFETGLSLDNDAAARMFLFHAESRANLEGYRDAGATEVEFSTAQNDTVCDSCNELNGKRYKLDEAPELPNPNCTNEMGCRCVYLPCVD